MQQPQHNNQTRYILRSRRGSHHLLEGRPISGTRQLDTCSRSELLELRERSERMLRHRTVVNTLADKGAKLKESINQIDALLLQNHLIVDDMITPENTFPDRESALTTKLASLTVNSVAYEARRKAKMIANARARSVNPVETTRRVPRRSSSASTRTLRRRHQQVSDPQQGLGIGSILLKRHGSEKAKVRMMTLDESVQLQAQHQVVIQQENAPVEKTTDQTQAVVDEPLSWTLRHMHLHPDNDSSMSISSDSSAKGLDTQLSSDDDQSSQDEENDYNYVYDKNGDDEDDDDDGQEKVDEACVDQQEL